MAYFNFVTTNIPAKSPEIYFTEPIAVQMRLLKERNQEKTSILKKSIPRQNPAGDEGMKNIVK